MKPEITHVTLQLDGMVWTIAVPTASLGTTQEEADKAIFEAWQAANKWRGNTPQINSHNFSHVFSWTHHDDASLTAAWVCVQTSIQDYYGEVTIK